MKLAKYNAETVIQEARLVLKGYNLHQVAQELKIPLATVSWHLLFALKNLDHPLWVEVDEELVKRKWGRRRGPHHYE